MSPPESGDVRSVDPGNAGNSSVDSPKLTLTLAVVPSALE
jgi:hypothetical protein